MSINADALSDGKVAYIANKGSELSGGPSFRKQYIHNQNGLVQLDGNEIISGKAAVINAHVYYRYSARHIRQQKSYEGINSCFDGVF